MWKTYTCKVHRTCAVQETSQSKVKRESVKSQPYSGKDKAQFLLNVVITVIVMTVFKDFGLVFYAI